MSTTALAVQRLGDIRSEAIKQTALLERIAEAVERPPLVVVNVAEGDEELLQKQIREFFEKERDRT